MLRSTAKGLTSVMATGVFDVIHIGHSTFLKDAKLAGDILFVGLEPDESARMNKGSSRPLNPIEERLQLIADLGCVDYVFAFEDAIPYGPAASERYNLRLKYLRPNKLALALGDPLHDLRKSNASKVGVEAVLVRGIWRSYSTTALLQALHKA